MTEITYTRQGDYNLPNLLPPQEEPVPHGKYALLRKKFLKEHRRVTYTNLLTSGKLNSHLAEIQQTAQRRMEEIVGQMAKAQGVTRSLAAMRSFGAALTGSVVAIGNAPTALFEVLRLVREEGVRPACIVGIPVGFVGAADSKKALAENRLVPYITVEGTKGGSPIAAAAVNAMLYEIDNSRD